MTDNSTQAGTSTLMENVSVESAAKSIEALLSDPVEKRKPVDAPVAQEAAPEADEADDTAPEEQAEQTASEAEEADDDTAETSSEAPEEEGEDGDAPDQLYTVKINGKDEQVPLSELISGYSRTSDYHQKTQALANERRSFYAEIEAVQQERAQYSQLLPALAQQIQSALPQPPSIDLLEADPVQYLRQKEIYERETERLSAAVSEMQRAEQLNAAEQHRTVAQMVAAARERLPELIPAWKDPKAYERDRTAMRSYLGKVGYSDEEINQAYDPRAVALAWKAMRYDELTSKTLKASPAPLEKAVRPTPAAPAPNQQNTARRASREARNRLAQTGRVDDAAAAIRALL